MPSPPYPGMPTGAAPFWAFPLFEMSMYLFFLLCLADAWRRGPQDLSYLLGGLVFGLLLEYMEVAMYSYSYGRFWVMLGRYPFDIPLCIGVGWGIIMYSARLFSSGLGLGLWACAALDTLLAINIDLSMDTIACRLHMWNWNWDEAGIDPLRAQWFGIPYANFVGWQTVVFCYCTFSRLLQRTRFFSAVITVLALGGSLAVLFCTEEYLFPFLAKIGITSLYRFVALLGVFILLVLAGGSGRLTPAEKVPSLAFLVPAWFHLFFFVLLWICGFYAGQPWMTMAACANLAIGIFLHRRPRRREFQL